MAPLLILALLITISKATPARIQKRDTHDHGDHDMDPEHCSLEYFGMFSLESLGMEIPQMARILRLISSDMPWEQFENFSFRTTVLGLFDNNTSQNAINYFLSKWSTDMEAEITKNAGAPYEENLIFDRKYTKMANQMMFDEVAKLSGEAMNVFDKANMEVHQCLGDPHHKMMNEMAKMAKNFVLLGQGISGAMIDWEEIHHMLDCSEEYLNNNDTAIMKALHSINVDPKECLGKARRLVDSLKRMSESSYLHKAPSILMEAALKMVQAMDIDLLWSAVYEVVLHSRGHCLQTDWNSVATGVIDGCDTACKGYWKLTTGQWPEMEKWLKNLMAEMQKDSFWMRLDKLYMSFVKEAKSMHTENKNMIMMMVHKQLMPMCTRMVNMIEAFSNDIERCLSIMAKYMTILPKMFPSYMIQEGLKMITHEMESFIFMLPNSNMICNITMKEEMEPMEEEMDMMAFFMAMEGEMTAVEDDLMPIEDDMTRMFMGVNQTLCELFFTDWPEGMMMPNGTDSMKMVVMDALLKINTALVTPYCKDHPSLKLRGSEYSDMEYQESDNSGYEYSEEASEPEPESENK